MKKVLVVDDNKDISEMIKYLLTKKNLHVCINTTGLNIFDVVLNYNPDLILLDISLPDKPGTEICKEVKQKYNMPIILLSAQNKNEKAIADCNADGFLQKPFHLKDLLDTISFHLVPVNK